MSYIYSLISKDPDLVLSEYTTYVGNFMQLLRVILQKKKKNDVKNEKLEESIEHLVCAIRFNIKNVFMIEYLVNYYQDNDLNKELVDIYKLIFIYTLNIFLSFNQYRLLSRQY